MHEITRLFQRRRHLIKLKEKLLAQDYQANLEHLKKARASDLALELRGSTDKEMLTLLANLDSYAQYRNLLNNIWSQNVANLNKLESGKTS